MTASPKRQMEPDRTVSERIALAALCQGTLSESARIHTVSRLMRYRFADPSHQIILQALASLHTVDPKRIRELLPIRVDSLGLPHANLDLLFAPQPLDEPFVALHLESLFA